MPSTPALGRAPGRGVNVPLVSAPGSVGCLALPAAAPPAAIPPVGAVPDRVQRSVSRLSTLDGLQPVRGVEVVLAQLPHLGTVPRRGAGPVALLPFMQGPQQALLSTRAAAAQRRHQLRDHPPLPVRNPLHGRRSRRTARLKSGKRSYRRLGGRATTVTSLRVCLHARSASSIRRRIGSGVSDGGHQVCLSFRVVSSGPAHGVNGLITLPYLLRSVNRGTGSAGRFVHSGK